MRKSKISREAVLEAYLNSMKIATVSLFVVEQREISPNARLEMGRINPNQVFAFMMTTEIDNWIQTNDELGLRGFQDFGVFQLRIKNASDGNDPEFARQIQILTPKEKEKLSFCFDAWNKAYHSFIGRIDSPDTLQLLLKSFEHARISSLANLIGDESAESVLADSTGEIARVADFIRQKISDGTESKLLHAGVVVEGTLLTSISRKQWRSILDELSQWGYLEKAISNDDKFATWLDYAFSFENEKSLKFASKIKLRWSNPSSLIELIMKFIDQGGIIYTSDDYSKIYHWIDRTIVFRESATHKSLRTIIRSHKQRKMNCFEVSRENASQLQLRVLVQARKVRRD